MRHWEGPFPWPLQRCLHGGPEDSRKVPRSYSSRGGSRSGLCLNRSARIQSMQVTTAWSPPFEELGQFAPKEHFSIEHFHYLWSALPIVAPVARGEGARPSFFLPCPPRSRAPRRHGVREGRLGLWYSVQPPFFRRLPTTPRLRWPHQLQAERMTLSRYLTTTGPLAIPGRRFCRLRQNHPC